MAVAMRQIPKIRGNTDPDPEWKLRGDMVDGKPVFIEALPNVKRVPKKGPDGKDVWRINPQTGEPISQRFILILDPDEPVLERQFVLDDLGNGMVIKNYHFAPQPGEVEARNAYLQGVNPEMAAMQSLMAAQQAELEKLRELVTARFEAALPELQAEIDDGAAVEDLDLDAIAATTAPPAEPEPGSLAERKQSTRSKAKK